MLGITWQALWSKQLSSWPNFQSASHNRQRFLYSVLNIRPLCSFVLESVQHVIKTLFCRLADIDIGASSCDYGSFHPLQTDVLQTRMRSHPARLDVWFLVGPFVFFHTSCVRTVKAPARPCRCAGSPELSLVGSMIVPQCHGLPHMVFFLD